MAVQGPGAWLLVRIAPPSGLSPEGPGADPLVALWWLMFWAGLAVFAGVVIALVLAIRRRREQPVEQDALTGEGAPGGSNWLVLIGGVALPVVVAVVLMVLMVTVGVDVRTLGRAAAGSDASLVIEVTGLEWWWDVEYPEADVRTANEIRIPAERRVEVHVASADVVHSFWVPALGPKIDMNPGATNTVALQADRPGVYRGLCTEYCGLQHARMQFVVEVLEPEEFDAWLADRQEPPPEPTEGTVAEGRALFESAECVRCHTVDGVSPHTQLGPDLSDLASRFTLGAGVEPNKPEVLAEWIADPHDLKPGVHMPPAALDGAELDALVAYLETLE